MSVSLNKIFPSFPVYENKSENQPHAQIWFDLEQN